MRRTWGDRQQIPNIEDIVIGNFYTLTINPSDKGQYTKSMKRITECISHGSYILNNYFPDCIAYPEISKKGRFHWHGILRFNHSDEICEFYIKLPILLMDNSVEIDTISNGEKWLEYCKKQHVFRQYCTKISMFKLPLQKGDKQLLLDFQNSPCFLDGEAEGGESPAGARLHSGGLSLQKPGDEYDSDYYEDFK